MELENAITWFEIPAADFDRAKKFYETIYDYQMPESMVGPTRMGFFMYDFKAGKVGGALCSGDNYTPSRHGALIYLNCQPDLQIVLDKVEQAGGKIILPKTQIAAGNGYRAIILDSEGNQVALHSRA
jgi:predicted enzyme related to lactoylglutathione lyase